jgi:uncharacterized protein YqfB (UPF0267 family)
MRTFKQVIDVIDYSKMVHVRIRNFFETLNEKSQSSRVKRMLEYLIEEHRRIEDILTRFAAETQKSVTNGWMQYTPSIDIDHLLDSHRVKESLSVDEIVHLMTDFNEALMNFYREAENEAEFPSVRGFFHNLAEMEIKENLQQLRASSFELMQRKA